MLVTGGCFPVIRGITTALRRWVVMANEQQDGPGTIRPWDAVDAWFECITQCPVDGGDDCISSCMRNHLGNEQELWRSSLCL